MSNLKITKSKHDKLPDDVTVVTLVGSLDTHTFSDFNNQITDFIKKGVTKIVFDITKLQFISSAGLGTLVGLCDEVEEADEAGFIKIFGLSDEINDIFDMMGFAELFEIYDNMDEVIDSL